MTSSAGALELDSMLWRLRSQRVIIINNYYYAAFNSPCVSHRRRIAGA